MKETAEACRKHVIKFGVYLSPWDRNCPLYGQGKAYDDYFAGQLTELLTNYGEIFPYGLTVCGPDIRWCGNEAGHTRVSEWSVVPERAKDRMHCSKRKYSLQPARGKLYRRIRA